MHNRIREARDTLKMSRAEFGSKIGVSGDVINNLERGRVEIKDHMIILICDKFNINETWLRTGEGEMFKQKGKDDLMVKLTMDILNEEEDSFKSRFVSLLARMTDDEWKMVEKMVNELAGGKKE